MYCQCVIYWCSILCTQSAPDSHLVSDSFNIFSGCSPAFMQLLYKIVIMLPAHARWVETTCTYPETINSMLRGITNFQCIRWVQLNAMTNTADMNEIWFDTLKPENHRINLTTHSITLIDCQYNLWVVIFELLKIELKLQKHHQQFLKQAQSSMDKTWLFQSLDSFFLIFGCDFIQKRGVRFSGKFRSENHAVKRAANDVCAECNGEKNAPVTVSKTKIFEKQIFGG